MAINKHMEQSNPDSCLNKAKDDEPLFVLKAKDPLFVQAVEHWLQQARVNGLHLNKLLEAEELIIHAKAWREKEGLVDHPLFTA